MVSVSTQANVAVGAQCEKGDLFNAEEIGCCGFKVSDLWGQVRMSTEDDGGFEQRRSGREVLQGGVEVLEG